MRSCSGPERPRPRRPRRRRCGPGAWPSSSASRRCGSTSRSSSAPPGSGARPPTTSSSPALPGLGKTTLAGIVAAEMGVGLADHQRAGAGAVGRPRRHPHEPRRGRRPLHRRDPPPPPDRRGGPLPGDGGLLPRHRHRQGPVGPVDPPRPAPLHAGRGHHPHRPDHRPAPRPVRLRRPARLLRHRRPRGRRAAGGPHPRRGAWKRTARPRSPYAPGVRPASPTGCCGWCATSPRSGPTGW